MEEYRADDSKEKRRRGKNMLVIMDCHHVMNVTVCHNGYERNLIPYNLQLFWDVFLIFNPQLEDVLDLASILIF